jgi:hypothetical protein
LSKSSNTPYRIFKCIISITERQPDVFVKDVGYITDRESVVYSALKQASLLDRYDFIEYVIDETKDPDKYGIDGHSLAVGDRMGNRSIYDVALYRGCLSGAKLLTARGATLKDQSPIECATKGFVESYAKELLRLGRKCNHLVVEDLDDDRDFKKRQLMIFVCLKFQNNELLHIVNKYHPLFVFLILNELRVARQQRKRIAIGS